MTTVQNDWILYSDYLSNSDYRTLQRQAGVKLEYMINGVITKKGGGYIISQAHIDYDRKRAEANSYPGLPQQLRSFKDDDEGKIQRYLHETERYEIIDSDKYYVRIEPKCFDKYLKVSSLLQVGDFVRFSGSKGYKWRKVLEIDGYNVHGQCASLPKESSLVFHSSSNGILTVLEIVRNGEKIF
jgi:hypothetical protein